MREPRDPPEFEPDPIPPSRPPDRGSDGSKPSRDPDDAHDDALGYVPMDTPFDAAGMQHLGADLAGALRDGDYHPVILVGTTFSGKTSLLLSLFATVGAQPGLRTGLSLCEPLLGSSSLVARELHEDSTMPNASSLSRDRRPARRRRGCARRKPRSSGYGAKTTRSAAKSVS